MPKHILLNDDEKKVLLENYKITPRQLPRILVNDPVISAMGGKIGDVVKITRKSSVSGEAVYYRVVIKG